MPNEEEMEKAFEGVAINIGYGFVHLLNYCTIGNLCRCTGYRPILDGYRTFCCKSNGGNCACNKDEYTGVIEVMLIEMYVCL